MVSALKILADMTLPREHSVPNTTHLILYIDNQQNLRNEQLRQRIIKPTQGIRFTHRRRMGFRGETSAKLPPTAKPEDSPFPYLTKIDRGISRTRCEYERQITEFGYVIQRLNACANTSLHGILGDIARPGVLGNRECRQIQRRADTPEIATTNTPTGSLLLQ